MPTRQLILLSTMAIAFLAFVIFAAASPYWSVADVVGLAVFGLFFLLLAFVLLAVRGQDPVEGHRGFPRSYWVVFASLAGAFALAMLLSVLAMPWVGYRGFAVLLGGEHWWVLPVLAAVLYPFISRHLL